MYVYKRQQHGAFFWLYWEMRSHLWESGVNGNRIGCNIKMIESVPRYACCVQ